ncbi:DUF3761 domain-containing protein [Methylobacterium sp. E-005]|uniref:DUF3761 domain-containing protein n=1 Tax=Methylobacterium sp. E-005 TaxID=2836549 RepID=UPI00391A47A1
MKFKSVAVALLVAAPFIHAGAVAARECRVFRPDELAVGTYRNVDGCTVPRPQDASCPPPRDAQYRCGDGDWSYAQHCRGACSHHGGVRCTVGSGRNCCP